LRKDQITSALITQAGRGCFEPRSNTDNVDNARQGAVDGLSGPKGTFDVEYRYEINGEWLMLLNDTTLTETVFSPLPGEAVYFRVSTEERVDNLGSEVTGPYKAALKTVKYYIFGAQRVAMRLCVVGGNCQEPLYLHPSLRSGQALRFALDKPWLGQPGHRPAGQPALAGALHPLRGGEVAGEPRHADGLWLYRTAI
jgi:hypothetical protein